MTFEEMEAALRARLKAPRRTASTSSSPDLEFHRR
jgi:hypothetical protein